MKLEGIHHISAITGDARGNVDFYTRVLGLRLVAKSVNQDDPSVYHLFYGDELAQPGADLTFFEYPGAIPGRAGAGMVHTDRLARRLARRTRLWAERLATHGVASERDGDVLRFADPGGLGHELVVDETSDEPARSPTTRRSRPSIALQGFEGVRAYSHAPESHRGAPRAPAGRREAH